MGFSSICTIKNHPIYSTLDDADSPVLVYVYWRIIMVLICIVRADRSLPIVPTVYYRSAPFHHLVCSVVDKDGLLGHSRTDMESLPAEVQPFVRSDMHDGLELLEVIRRAEPTGLFGLSTVGGLFKPEHLRMMREVNNTENRRPLIFALSNPTSSAECSCEDAATHAGPSTIFSSGSPFEDAHLADGSVVVANQGNNFLVFGGIGLGALLSGSSSVTDTMLARAAEALPKMLKDDDLERGMIYPSIADIREISVSVAAAVMDAAVECEVASIPLVKRLKLLDDGSGGNERMKRFVRSKMFQPTYVPLVYTKQKQASQRAFRYEREAGGGG